MSKYERQPLARGIKFNPPTQWAPAQTIAADAASTAVDDNSADLPLAPFRVSLHIPAIPNSLEPADDSAEFPTRALCVPFMLIEPQDTFNPNGSAPTNTRVILDEVSFGWDQRAEPAAIEGTPNEGDLQPTLTDRLTMRIALVAKPCRAFDEAAPMEPQREIWSGTIDGSNFAGTGFRPNPALWTDINAQVSPTDTLAWVLTCPGLYDAGTTLMLPSVTVSMRFLRNLRGRLPSTDLQNAPTLTGNTATNDFSFGISVPLQTDEALADGVGGISTELEKFDELAQAKLKGGANRDGYLPNVEHLAEVESYFLIAVPMWTNLGPKGFATAADAANFPYKAAEVVFPVPPNPDHVTDQRIIPLEQPVVIHHVLLAANYCAPDANPALSGLVPSGATFVNEVGVALYNGPDGDSVEFQQVAHSSFTVAGKLTNQIDQWRFGWNQLMTGPLFGDAPNFELFVCPLVGAGGVSFNDMWTGAAIAQGQPVYTGRLPWGLRARTDINGAPGTNLGAEQSLVVRWSLQDSLGLLAAAGDTKDVLAGLGGHWVLIIGTTPLTSTRFDRSE